MKTELDPRWRRTLEDLVADPGEDLETFYESTQETIRALLDGREPKEDPVCTEPARV